MLSTHPSRVLVLDDIYERFELYERVRLRRSDYLNNATTSEMLRQTQAAETITRVIVISTRSRLVAQPARTLFGLATIQNPPLQGAVRKRSRRRDRRRKLCGRKQSRRTRTHGTSIECEISWIDLRAFWCHHVSALVNKLFEKVRVREGQQWKLTTLPERIAPINEFVRSTIKPALDLSLPVRQPALETR